MTKDQIIEGTLKALLESREDLKRRFGLPTDADLDAMAEEDRARRLTNGEK